MLRLSIVLLLLFLGSFFTHAQNYVDVLKIHTGSTLPAQFDGWDEESTIQTLDVNLTYPIKLSDQLAIITGVDFGRYHLDLFPLQESPTSFYSTTLKLGASVKHNDKLSGTYVLLPKLVADYDNLSGSDFQMGAVSLFKYKTKENFSYKFGVYGSTENFGFFVTPLLGFYYQSLNKKLEVNLLIPSTGDINYALADWLNIGGGFNGGVRSYNFGATTSNFNARYSHRNMTDILGYFQFNLLKKSVLLKTAVGYSINDFTVFGDDDKIDLGFAAFNIGDARTQLNPDLNNGLILQLGLIYRFHLPSQND